MEVGIPRGRQLEALLAALVQQNAAQQLVGRPHVVAEERGRVLRDVAQCPGQPQDRSPSICVSFRLSFSFWVREQAPRWPLALPRTQGPSLSSGNPLLRKEL